MYRYKNINIIAAFLLSVSSAQAQTLIGGITVNDQYLENDKPVTRKLVSAGDAKLDDSALNKRDCICFNNNRVQAKNIDGRWKLVDGDHWILDFADNQSHMAIAEKTIKTYKLNEICFVGRNTPRPMMYFLSDGQAPQGTLEGEDELPFNTEEVKAEQINGSWKVTCGSNWMEDFARDADAAKAAVAQIKYYGFNKHCFVGRPGPPMEYFKK